MAEITAQDPQSIPQPPQASNLQMILAMGGVGFFAGILIVLTYQLTLPIINKNKAAFLDKALFEEVVRAATHKAAFTVSGDQFTKVEGDAEQDAQVFACYNDENELVGVAVRAAGQRVQEEIRLVYGYDPEREIVIGMKVLESKETPGLGDKIEKDPNFVANFDSLDASLEHPITFVKPGEKDDPWEIDGITGATISAKAVAKILRESTQQMVPLIEQNLNQLKH